MTRILCSLTALVVALCGTLAAAGDQPAPRPATAAQRTPHQAPALPNRVFIHLNGGVQSSDLTFTDTRTEAALGETRSWTADYTVKSGPQFDVGGGVRVWRNLSVHRSYARFSDSRVAAIAGQVPHPFFFDRPRTIDGESARLKLPFFARSIPSPPR